LLLLQTLGANVSLAGPPALLPEKFTELGASVSHDFDASLAQRPDVVMMLRVQKERMLSNFDNEARYVKDWSLSTTRLGRLGNQTVIMHPGPINRGLEISSAVADDPRSAILQQVTNGVAVRMAVLRSVLAVHA
jgi:aspartate carbamoyltransferase catalytic subunit